MHFDIDMPVFRSKLTMYFDIDIALFSCKVIMHFDTDTALFFKQSYNALRYSQNSTVSVIFKRGCNAF